MRVFSTLSLRLNKLLFIHYSYRDGRTETVRPCTADSCAFVKGMMDPNLPVWLKLALLLTITLSETCELQ